MRWYTPLFSPERSLHEALRGIVTHNRLDFEQLHRRYLAAGQEHAGIIIAARRLPHELATRIVTLLNALTADEIHNQLLYV